MTFLNPLLLLAGLGVALPILAHLLNRHRVQHTPWAAMQFINRNVRIRSRQMRLKDILLLLLRCLAVLLLGLALAKPVIKEAEGVAESLGERRAGVIIALDTSYSMQHSDGSTTRFERAIEQIRAIAEGIHAGDPVCLVLLGAEHKVVARNMAFDSERFEAILQAQQATPESLNLDSVPMLLKELADGIDAPQKEIYIVTDMQTQDWKIRPAWLTDALEELGKTAATVIVPVRGDSDNLAITNLELVSGVLRKGTIARYRATVRNCGTVAVSNVKVRGRVNQITVDTKTIPAIAAGASETVSLFIHFHNPGPVRITAELDMDSLPVDNVRRTVAIIRDRVSVLCVEGSSGRSSSRFITTALRARGNTAGHENFVLQSVPWVDLPTQDLSRFDVVILQDVPAITADQARGLEEYVRGGNGLIWFAGENTDAKKWNERSASNKGIRLLPAGNCRSRQHERRGGSGKTAGPDNARSFGCAVHCFRCPEDLLSETRFRKLLQVKPSATSFTVLSLAGTAAPVVLEHSIGRGHVFMFTTSAGSQWNNMAVTPVFPMILQQMVTYLTAREFEKPRLVGDSLALSYVEQPDASEAVFDTPSAQMISVPVREHRNQYVALLDHAREAGFYLARVSVQAPGMPVAVNVETKESNVKCLTAAETMRSFEDTGISVALSEAELLDAVEQTRTGRSFWLFCMLTGLGLLVIESLLADRLFKRAASTNETTSASENS